MRLELTGVTKRFGNHAAVDSVDLLVEQAQCLVLVGPSGSGKSTLLRILGGLEAVDAGRVQVDGVELPRTEEGLRAFRCTIGTVFQAFNLFPHLTALRNITLPLEKVHGIAPEQAEAIARKQLARFRLEPHAGKKPAEMSGGQRQRVAIARALSIRPRLLLFDEPTSALDPEMTAEVLDVIEKLREEGRDLILVTHQMAFARRVADHAIFVAEGRVLESGAGTELFENPRNRAARDFLARVLRY